MRITILLLVAVTTIVVAEDFEYSTGGSMGTPATTGGSNTGWGEWFITSVLNDAGQDITLTQIAFPCCGDASGLYGWVVWTDVGGLVAPAGDVSTCDYYGSYVPADPDSTFPPDTYTYVDLSSENIIIADGDYFCFGYDNTQIGGQIGANGNETWSWYNNMWDPDSGWGRTALLEVYANYTIALEHDTWGAIKSSF